VGSEIAHEFGHRNVPFVIVETNPTAIGDAQKLGYLVVEGDATTDVALREAGIDRARGLLAASDSDSGNTFIVLTAKTLRPELYVVSRAGRPESESRMHRAGADRVFSPYIIAGRQMAHSALQPMVAEFIDTLATGRAGEKVLAEIDVSGAPAPPARQFTTLHTCPSVVVLAVRFNGELAVAARARPCSSGRPRHRHGLERTGKNPARLRPRHSRAATRLAASPPASRPNPRTPCKHTSLHGLPFPFGIHSLLIRS
jgi:Trk K+ transport system NAD-binding subunit